MSLAYKAYVGLTAGAYFSLLPFYRCWKRFSASAREASFPQRMGDYSDTTVRSVHGTPRVWLHAVSVGEVRVAQAVMSALSKHCPAAAFILSTTTGHGKAAAAAAVSGSRITSVYAPADFPASVRKALKKFRPDILVCMETEIWPNWLMAAAQLGIPTAIVNGRLSVRSIRTYKKVLPLMQTVLGGVGAFSMIHGADAERIVQLGADPNRIFINGNAKFDLLSEPLAPADLRMLSERYGAYPGRPVVVAGSVRGDEPKMVLAAFRQVQAAFPDALLILVPRHVTRAGEIQNLVRSLGFSCRRGSDLVSPGKADKADVIVVDVMGELKALYGIARLVFCGGSLVPLGGQNVLEAAVWGKPVCYGPHMDDFPDAKELLAQCRGAVQVDDAAGLGRAFLKLLQDPEAASAMGRRARAAVMSRRGAADKHAQVICRLLSGRRHP